MASGAQQTALMLSDDDAPNVSTARSRRELNRFESSSGHARLRATRMPSYPRPASFGVTYAKEKFCWTCFKSHKD
jgi:hypothetical protein